MARWTWTFPAVNALTTDAVVHTQILTSLSVELSNMWKEIDALKEKGASRPYPKSGEN